MSNTYANQQFRPPPASQFFERLPQQAQTHIPSETQAQDQARVETPIQQPQPRGLGPPPQVQLLPPRRRKRQSAQPVPLQTQPYFESQAELDEQLRQAEQAYDTSYHGDSRPQPLFHTIDPTNTTIPTRVLLRPRLPELPTDSPPPNARYILPQPSPTTPQANGQSPVTPQHPQYTQHAQQIQQTQQPQQTQQTPQAQTAQAGEGQSFESPESEDEEMQDGEPSSDDDEGDGHEGEGNADEAAGSPGKEMAPLIQPITPLQYPAVRPTLLLGPYETRQEAQTALIEYGIAQGYMLIQTGCARSKRPWGAHGGDRPLVRVDFMCDRSGICKNQGAGKRKRPTHKLGCPTRIMVVCRKRDGCKWFIDPRVEMHNHDLNLGNMESIAAYRRWRRIQGGGRCQETRKERSERQKRIGQPRPPGPVPPPTFHNVGPPPPSEPTGPVHMAALKGQVKILQILLNKGGDIDAYDSTGMTALHRAIEGARMDAFKLLIDRGASVTRCDSKGLSPLRMAVEKGMEDAVVMLIEKGADPNR